VSLDRPPLDQDDCVRVPIDLLREQGVTAAIIRVYGAIRHHAGFEAAADNFLKSWPSVRTIAREAGVSRASVIRAVAWLGERDYLVHDRRPNRSSDFSIITNRSRFREIAAREGRAGAIHDFEVWRGEKARLSRQSQAKAAAARMPVQARGPARRSHPCDRPGDNGDGRSQPQELGGISGEPSGVSAVNSGSVDQVIRASEIRGAADATPRESVGDQLDDDKRRTNAQGPRMPIPTWRPRKMPDVKPMTDAEFEAERQRKLAMARRLMGEA